MRILATIAICKKLGSLRPGDTYYMASREEHRKKTISKVFYNSDDDEIELVVENGNDNYIYSDWYEETTQYMPESYIITTDPNEFKRICEKEGW